MKYTKIMAGVFSLMALAACTNNDEVTMEQPKEVHTITVAYNKGANTRVGFTSYNEDDLMGFKGSWEEDDALKLLPLDDDGNVVSGTSYTYKIDPETINEEDGTATFISQGSAPTDGKYLVVYPADWNGGLSGEYIEQNFNSIYDNNYKFDIKNFCHAMAKAQCSGGSFAEINLKPIFNILYIPEDLVVTNMQLIDWFEDGFAGEIEVDGSTRKAINGFVELKGDNLYYTINDYAGGATKGSIKIRTINSYSSWPLYYNEDANQWQFEGHTMIAFPVLPDQTPVTNLRLIFDGLSCYFYNSDGKGQPEFTEGGHLYNLDDGNLQFRAQ